MSSSPMQPLAILLLAAAIVPGLAAGTSSIINKTCAAVSVPYAYCVDVLSADPAGASAADTRGLATVAANLTEANVTSTVQVIAALVQDLSVCLKYYRQVDEWVAGALGDIRAGRALAASGKLSQAQVLPDFCDLQLFQGTSRKNPLYKENVDAGTLARLAADITQLLWKKGS